VTPLPILAASLILVGLAVMTLAVVASLRGVDAYLRVHAAAGAPFGVVLVLAGSLGSGDAAIIVRAALVAAFVLLTAPVSAHAIGRAAYRKQREDEQDT
jgi:multicomponent Na+:H+ antiporter subunit G